MHSNDKEIREEYKSQLGHELGTALHGLRNQWAWALMRLKEFRELFGKQEDVALLNAITGGAFTWDIQQIFWEDILLRVCRLTDPHKSAGKSNLSIWALPPFVQEKQGDPSLEVQSLVKEATGKAKFARDWRNGRI